MAEGTSFTTKKLPVPLLLLDEEVSQLAFSHSLTTCPCFHPSQLTTALSTYLSSYLYSIYDTPHSLQQALYLTIKQDITVTVYHQATTADSSEQQLPTVLSATDLYTIFFQKQAKFPLKYKVYSYFRDQGCCVHTAVNYGLDYAIYQTLPALCHSALSVLVIDGVSGYLSANDSPSDNGGAGGEETLRWTHMSAMTRVMGVCTSCLS